MRMAAVLILVVGLASPVWATASASPSTAPPPSVAKTQSVEFLGKRFQRKWQSLDTPVLRYEYYPDGQVPENWFELTEFQIYPRRAANDDPRELARRMILDLRRKYPEMRFGLYQDKKTGASLLDFLYPTSTRHDPGKHYLEFDAFKFFLDPASHRLIGFHYAKNIEAPSASRSKQEVISEIRHTRQEVIPAMARFQPYRP